MLLCIKWPLSQRLTVKNWSLLRSLIYNSRWTKKALSNWDVWSLTLLFVYSIRTFFSLLQSNSFLFSTQIHVLAIYSHLIVKKHENNQLLFNKITAPYLRLNNTPFTYHSPKPLNEAHRQNTNTFDILKQRTNLASASMLSGQGIHWGNLGIFRAPYSSLFFQSKSTDIFLISPWKYI